MQQNQYPVIDPVATGENIVRLRQERSLSVRDLKRSLALKSRKRFTSGSAAKAFRPLITCTLLVLCSMCLWMKSWYQQGHN